MSVYVCVCKYRAKWVACILCSPFRWHKILQIIRKLWQFLRSSARDVLLNRCCSSSSSSNCFCIIVVAAAAAQIYVSCCERDGSEERVSHIDSSSQAATSISAAESHTGESSQCPLLPLGLRLPKFSIANSSHLGSLHVISSVNCARCRHRRRHRWLPLCRLLTCNACNCLRFN